MVKEAFPGYSISQSLYLGEPVSRTTLFSTVGSSLGVDTDEVR